MNKYSDTQGEKKESSYRREIVQNRERNDRVIRGVLERLGDERVPGIVFVKWLEHGETLKSLLESAGVDNVPLVHGQWSATKRNDLAAKIRQGEGPRVVVATMAWSTGVNIPCLRWVLWAGGGRAPIQLVQASGRGSRISDGKQSFEIIDIEDSGKRGEDLKKRQENMKEAGYGGSPFLDGLVKQPRGGGAGSGGGGGTSGRRAASPGPTGFGIAYGSPDGEEPVAQEAGTSTSLWWWFTPQLDWWTMGILLLLILGLCSE